MKKLQKQAHDALNKVQATEDMVGIRTELERLGGKTHLICPTSEKQPGCDASDVAPASNSPGPIPAPAPTTAANPVPASACEPPLQPDMIHPTIMEDMQRFDMDVDGLDSGEQFNMDFPPNAFDPRQAVDFSAFPEFDFTVGLAPPDVWGTNGAGGSGPGMGVHGINGVNGTHVNGAPGANGMNGMNGVNGFGGTNGPPVFDATWQALVEQLGF